jgi:dehydrogenase/reductase SDR family protein 7B
LSKKVVITGASSGIGKALAIHAAQLKYSISICARNSQALEEVASICRNLGATVYTHTTDISQLESCQQFIENSAKQLGGIDILINNAGMSMRANFAQTQPEVIEKIIQVNLFGAMYCTRYAMPYLLASKGSVVGISSIAGFVGLPGRTGYSASKFALHGFLEALRTENLHTGLHVLIACPGFTASNIRNTALNAQGKAQGESPREEQKMMTAEEVASITWDAIHKRKNIIIMTFQGKLSYWMQIFFPNFLRKSVYKHMKQEPDAPF